MGRENVAQKTDLKIARRKLWQMTFSVTLGQEPQSCSWSKTVWRTKQTMCILGGSWEAVAVQQKEGVWGLQCQQKSWETKNTEGKNRWKFIGKFSNMKKKLKNGIFNNGKVLAF